MLLHGLSVLHDLGHWVAQHCWVNATPCNAPYQLAHCGYDFFGDQVVAIHVVHARVLQHQVDHGLGVLFKAYCPRVIPKYL